MNSNTMRFLKVAIGVLSLWPATALTQAWPGKPIRIVVPFPAGGGVDYIGRIVGKGLSERLGQQVVIDNRPGASGIIKQKNIIDRMLKDGAVPTPTSPEEFSAYMKSELRKWGEVVKMANVKSE